MGQTWHAGLAIDICGKEEPALAATASSGSGSGLSTTGNGVLLIAPKVPSEAGNNATLGKFAKEDGTLTLTNTSVQYPGGVAYKNGQKCAAGTPDAGKVGVVRARWWTLKGKQAGGRRVHLDTGEPQASQQPIDHPRVRAVQRNAAQGAGVDRTGTPAGDQRHVGSFGDDDHHDRGDDHHDSAVGHDDHHDRAVRHDNHDQVFGLMKAVVLVGGEGTRLRPLTLSTPKQMLPIVGVPMIERVLAHLASHGVDEAILSLGYLPDAFKVAYPDGHAAGVSLTYAVEPQPLDTAGAVRFAATYGGVEETFVVVNGDVLTDLDLGSLVAFHRRSGAEGTIALHPVPDPSAFGVVPTDGEGRVTAFVEKPPRDEAPTNEINAGTYVLEPAVLDRIPSSGRVSIERETFPAMVRSGVLFARSDDGYWLDTGTPAAYLQANRDLMSGQRKGVPIPGIDRGDQVFVEGDSAIAGRSSGPPSSSRAAPSPPAARVERSVVGAGSIIESGAVVLDSVLMDGSHVAANATVAGSVLGPHAIVGQRADVRPISVLGAGAVVASGTLVDGERVEG